MAFDGLRVLSLESRRANEIEALIRRYHGDPFVAPSVRETASSDPSEAICFVERLEGGDFDMVVCMTGSGLAFLRDAVSATISSERLGAALRRASIVSRGPKPVTILRTLGVPVQVMIPEPNTWKEIVAAIADRPERRIAVQEYGRANVEMNAALERLGASVTPVSLYRWELPEDAGPLREAARRLAGGEVDVILFTSSIQLDHLLEVSREMGIEDAVRHALSNQVVIASVGPVMTASLEAKGFTPVIVPDRPKIAPLVKTAAEHAHEFLRGSAR